MTRPALAEYIESAMKRTRRDAAAIQRLTGVPATWTRQLKSGRMKNRPDPERLAKVAGALGLDEAELWAYFGRADMIAVLRAAPPPPAKAEADPIAAAIRAQTAVLEKYLGLLADHRKLQARVEEMDKTLARLVEAGPLAADNEAPATPPARRRTGE